MKIELSHATPYLIFFFGCLGTFIAWSTKEILQNIKDDLKELSGTTRDHGQRLNSMESFKTLIEFKVQTLDSKVDKIAKAGKINPKGDKDAELR